MKTSAPVKICMLATALVLFSAANAFSLSPMLDAKVDYDVESDSDGVTTLASQAGCCGVYTGGISGNTNCSDDGALTLSDITRLIDHVYVSREPLCCHGSGNTNGSEDCKITLSDITALIDAVYISRMPPAECIPECDW